MGMKKCFIIVSTLLLGFVFFSCNTNRLKVDIDEVKIAPVHIQRLDRDLFGTPLTKLQKKEKEMEQRYGKFYKNYLRNVVGMGLSEDSLYVAIDHFTKDQDLKKVYQTVQQLYTDEEMQKLEQELEQAFRYFHYHFPNAELPRYYSTLISGFNFQALTHDSTLGIALDMYMGASNPYYQMLQWPHYKTMQLSKEYILADAMEAWIYKVFDNNEPVHNLLNHMIFYGKLFYCMDAFLPDVHDSVKIAYTSKQIDYCRHFEKNLWAYFTEKDRLYKNDLKEVAEYTNEGPFTSAINKDCPPRIAMWVGWQIVRAYMNRHEKVSLEQLMNEKDPQKILAGSKYKP